MVRVKEAAAVTGEHRAPLPPAPRVTSSTPARPPPPSPQGPPSPTPVLMELDDLLVGASPPAPAPSRPVSDPGRPSPGTEAPPPRRPTAALRDLDPVVEGSMPVARPMSSPSMPSPRPTTAAPPRPTTGPGAPPPQRQVSAVDQALPFLAAADALPAAPSPPSVVAAAAHSVSLLRMLPVAAAGLAVVALVTVVVVVGALRASSAAFTQAEARQLVDVWLKQGAWGRPRLDEVVVAVDAVGKPIMAPLAARLGETPPRVVVLREAERAQGIALADGTVVVTTGTLRRLQSEAELAAVLAHAFAHLALGDAARALDAHPGRTGAREVLQSNRPHPAAAVVDQLLSSPASAGDPASVEAEARAVTLTLQTLKATGWSEAAFQDVVTRLAGTTWASQHPVPPSLGPALQQAPRGREQRLEYSRTILDRVTPLLASPPTTTTTTPTTPTTGRP